MLEGGMTVNQNQKPGKQSCIVVAQDQDLAGADCEPLATSFCPPGQGHVYI